MLLPYMCYSTMPYKLQQAAANSVCKFKKQNHIMLFYVLSTKIQTVNLHCNEGTSAFLRDH